MTRTETLPARGKVLDRRGKPIDLTRIEPLMSLIVGRWNPTAIWLFGSRARGDAREGSDWDLLVVVSDDSSDDDIGHLATWRVQRESGIRADVIACRASEFHEDAGTPNTLVHEVATTGVLIRGR